MRTAMQEAFLYFSSSQAKVEKKKAIIYSVLSKCWRSAKLFMYLNHMKVLVL